jgi:orotidine-5'-phosphate decarboxylase
MRSPRRVGRPEHCAGSDQEDVVPTVSSRVILALDVPRLAQAKAVAVQAAPALAAVKIGSQLFTAEGPAAVQAMHELGLRVFLDLKFHDIPNTVAGAVAAARDLGVWMLNVHGSGGPAMLQAAARAVPKGESARPIVLAVTVLTSLGEAELQATLGTQRRLPEQVTHLAREAQRAGLDGVVASPHEIRMIRVACPAPFLIVTPGVRPAPGHDAGRGRARGRRLRRGGPSHPGRHRPRRGGPSHRGRVPDECRMPRAES